MAKREMYRTIDEKRLYDYTYIWYTGTLLTGKDEVPAKFRSQIKEVCDECGVFCSMRMSWMYAHTDFNGRYVYDEAEPIYVEIWGNSAFFVNKAKREIEMLELSM